MLGATSSAAAVRAATASHSPFAIREVSPRPGQGRARRRAPRGVAPSRRGLSIIYVALFLVVLIGIVSLGVDVGRVRLARAEVQNAADAAAHSGARSLPVGQTAVEDAAVQAAADNAVIDQDDSTGHRINQGLEIFPEDDVEVGIWDPNARTFTALDDNGGTRTDERRAANAVHVIGRRIQARNNPIPLIFAPVVGVFHTDVTQQAIAYVHGGPDRFGFVGLDFVDSNGNTANIDSVLLPSLARRENGGVASNGDIDLRNGDVYGDVRPGVGKDLTQGPNSLITGWTADLDQPLSYTPDAFPNPLPPNNNGNITPSLSSGLLDKNGGFSLSGNTKVRFPANGVYTFKGWNQNGNRSDVTITAPATIYIDGNFDFSAGTMTIVASGDDQVRLFVNGDITQHGGTFLNQGLPKNLSISDTKPDTNVTVAGTPTIKAHVYARSATPSSTARQTSTAGSSGSRSSSRARATCTTTRRGMIRTPSALRW